MQPLEMALEAALLVIQNGGSTVAAERSLRNILTGFRQEGVVSIWRLDFIGAWSTANGPSSMVVRPVGPIGVNLARASEVAALGRRAAKGQVEPAALGSELTRIRNLPAPYNRGVMIVGAACAAAAFSQLPGGDWGSLAIAFVAAGVGQFLRSLLQARKMAVVPVTLACAALSACIGSTGLRLGLSQTAPPALLASVIYLVPGLPLINGFIDVASHKHLVVGIERIANATFLFLVIAIALVMAVLLLGPGEAL